MRRRPDVWIVLGLLVAAWGIRLALASRLVFPPLDDPAFYLQTARHLAEGRGLVSDVIWSYQFPFAEVTHPSHEYWMPVATWLMAPWIRVFGDSLLVAQIPGTLCGALLVPLTYALGRIIEPGDRRLALGAALMPLAGALPVYQSASTDSAAPFAILGASALLAGGLAIERRSAWLSLLAGALGGVAYLTRSDGMLIPMVIGALTLWRVRPPRRSASQLGLLAAGAIAPMAAWWIRNWLVFGATQPVAPTIAAALQDYAQMFNWDDPPRLESLLDQGAGFVAGLRLQAAGHNLGVWALIAFPYGLFGWLELVRSRRAVASVGLAYAVLLFLASALVFSVPTLAGLFYHSAGAFVPWLAVGAAMWIARIGRWRQSAALGLGVATAALIVAQCGLAWARAVEDSAGNGRTYAAIAAWLATNLPPDEPVIANQAHSVNYASGQPAMSLPAGQEIGRMRDLAERYGARYVVLTERVGRYPEALDEQLGAGIELVQRMENALIYRIDDPIQ